MLSNIMSTAVSGLAVNSQRAGAAANNIANLNTKDYERVEIRSTSVSTEQTSSTSYAAGGVQGVVSRGGNVSGLLGVDLTQEVVTLIQAETAYGANLKVLQAADEMSGELLKVKA